MTVLTEVLLALLLATFVVLVLTGGLRRTGPWDSVIWLFLVVFLGIWAFGAWAEPVGPSVGDVVWLPFLFAALFLGLLLAAVPTDSRTITLTPTPPEAREEVASETAVLGVFFWILVAGLVLAALAGATG